MNEKEMILFFLKNNYRGGIRLVWTFLLLDLILLLGAVYFFMLGDYLAPAMLMLVVVLDSSFIWPLWKDCKRWRATYEEIKEKLENC